MKEQIKELRVKIDGLSQLVKELKPFELGEGKHSLIHVRDIYGKVVLDVPVISLQLSKAYDSLILAKAWLGKVLGELGAENPYKSGYKTVEDIEPTADKANPTTLQPNSIVNKIWEGKSHIEKVDWLRQEIEKLVNNVKDINLIGYTMSREFNIARTNSYNHLCEAKFWLRFESQRIKEVK